MAKNWQKLEKIGKNRTKSGRKSLVSRALFALCLSVSAGGRETKCFPLARKHFAPKRRENAPPTAVHLGSFREWAPLATVFRCGHFFWRQMEAQMEAEMKAERRN